MYSSHKEVSGRAKSAHYAITRCGRKTVLADFNLAVSSPTAKLPHLIPRPIVRLYGTWNVDTVLNILCVS